MLVSLVEWDVSEVPLGGRQSGGEDELSVFTVKANIGEKGDKVAAILLVLWVLPINYTSVS